ncbi:MAG: hypothetical protein NC120_11375 [Ruminococcus sp.]|nr:hypothetical protein [Ruminococcus sp.]
MDYLEQQYIEVRNVLSYRARVDVNRLKDILRFAEKNVDALGFTVTENLLFTVTETFCEKNKCIADIEILIPVNKAFESSEQYIYKPVFKLVNAVSVRHYGLYSEIGSVRSSLEQFLLKKSLKPVSSIYYKVIRNSEEQPCDSVLDAFISVNANQL